MILGKDRILEEPLRNRGTVTFSVEILRGITFIVGLCCTIFLVYSLFSVIASCVI